MVYKIVATAIAIAEGATVLVLAIDRAVGDRGTAIEGVDDNGHRRRREPSSDDDLRLDNHFGQGQRRSPFGRNYKRDARMTADPRRFGTDSNGLPSSRCTNKTTGTDFQCRCLHFEVCHRALYRWLALIKSWQRVYNAFQQRGIVLEPGTNPVLSVWMSEQTCTVVYPAEGVSSPC